MDVSRYLAYKRPFFGARAVELLGATHESTRLGAMLSIKEYGPETAAGMLDSFLTLQFEFVLTQSLSANTVIPGSLSKCHLGRRD